MTTLVNRSRAARADDGEATTPFAWEERLQRVAITVGRIGLAVLFFTQLFWKLPPTFGCPPDFAFTTEGPNGQLVRTSGLCDWIGIESVWAKREHKLLVVGGVGVPITPLAAANGAFIDNVIKPTIGFSGWLVWGAETFAFVSLLLGLFSRLGALAALGISAQLMVGLAGISDPYEWEWGYNQMVLLSILMLGLAPGRIFGLDARLRPRLAGAAAGGNRLARLALALT